MLKFFRKLFAPAPSPEVIERREAVYTAYFGADPQIYHPADWAFPHVDVYHFGPTLARPFHTLITGGMAEYRQAFDEGSARLELMLYGRTFPSWAAGLLKVMGEYPSQHQTYFAAYHTVPFGGRLSESSDIVAFLLAPMENEDSSQLAFTVEGERVEYLVCVPITQAEYEFAQEVSSEQLYQRLKRAGVVVHTDDDRQSVV